MPYHNLPPLAGLPLPGAWMATVMFFIFMVTLPLMLFSIPLLAIWTNHRRRMEEMRLQRQSSMSREVQAEFAALREEIKSLRDTTMQYDLSFDTALQGLERRIVSLERPNYMQSDDSKSSQSYVAR